MHLCLYVNRIDKGVLGGCSAGINASHLPIKAASAPASLPSYLSISFHSASPPCFSSASLPPGTILTILIWSCAGFSACSRCFRRRRTRSPKATRWCQRSAADCGGRRLEPASPRLSGRCWPADSSLSFFLRASMKSSRRCVNTQARPGDSDHQTPSIIKFKCDFDVIKARIRWNPDAISRLLTRTRRRCLNSPPPRLI